MNIRYKPPLVVYVVWHPSFPDGQLYADFLYSTFTREIKNPLERGIGIPVFYRSTIYKNGVPIPINLNEAERSIVVFLVDNFCKINWQDYARIIYEQFDGNNEGSSDKHRFFSVAFNTAAHTINKKINEQNFIRLYPGNPNDQWDIERKKSELRIRLTNELCRLLYEEPRITEIDNEIKVNPPVQLFLSHAKKDGVDITTKIKSYIESETPIKTFFDSLDLEPGTPFRKRLNEVINYSALLVIQTDAFSSREWCRWEVLRAKKQNRPVVIVNALTTGEQRSFPYLGNVPVIRWYDEDNEKNALKRIIDLTLLEVLRYKYTRLYMDSLISQLIRVENYKILSSPPELITLIEKVKEGSDGLTIIYPDPPLGSEEMEILQELEKYNFTTPTLLIAISHNSNR